MNFDLWLDEAENIVLEQLDDAQLERLRLAVSDEECNRIREQQLNHWLCEGGMGRGHWCGDEC